ncbi:MAG: ADP-ribosylglycohydrolase family protein [Myxococcota bacterium]
MRPTRDGLPTEDQYRGVLLGLAAADALGAPFEGGPLERLVWQVLGRDREGRRRWTDDTQMSIDVLETYLTHGGLDQDRLAVRFAASYRWSRGYGPGAARVLRRIRKGQDWRSARRTVYPEGSYGNGGAMRAPVVALVAATADSELSDIIEATRRVAEITHAHEQALQGSSLVGLATFAALLGRAAGSVIEEASAAVTDEQLAQRWSVARSWLRDGASPNPAKVRTELGAGMLAVDSCVTATYLALHHLTDPFEVLLDSVRELGGDVDTIGAMAGGIWGAHNGAARLPSHLLQRVEKVEDLEDLADRVCRTVRGLGPDTLKGPPRNRPEP